MCEDRTRAEAKAEANHPSHTCAVHVVVTAGRREDVPGDALHVDPDTEVGNGPKSFSRTSEVDREGQLGPKTVASSAVARTVRGAVARCVTDEAAEKIETKARRQSDLKSKRDRASREPIDRDVVLDGQAFVTDVATTERATKNEADPIGGERSQIDLPTDLATNQRRLETALARAEVDVDLEVDVLRQELANRTSTRTRGAQLDTTSRSRSLPFLEGDDVHLVSALEPIVRLEVVVDLPLLRRVHVRTKRVATFWSGVEPLFEDDVGVVRAAHVQPERTLVSF